MKTYAIKMIDGKTHYVSASSKVAAMMKKFGVKSLPTVEIVTVCKDD